MPDYYKTAIRNTIKNVRATIPLQYHRAASSKICRYIGSLECYKNAQNIAFYSASQREVDLTLLWRDACLDGKSSYFPVLTSEKTLSFLPATKTTPFQSNKYGILEPALNSELALPIESFDLIIVPLVAFDNHCNRIGMGAGYYDRTLEQAKPGLLMGVGFTFQRLPLIIHEPWDIPLDAVVTPETIYWR